MATIDNIEIRVTLERQFELLAQQSEYCAENDTDYSGLAHMTDAMVVLAETLGYPMSEKGKHE